MSLPDEFMTRKANNLVAREAGSHPHAVPQPFNENRPQIPDNWVAAKTGTYFAERAANNNTSSSRSPHRVGLAASTSQVSPSRKTPTERQHEMDDKVQTLTAHALELYEESERERSQQCKARRDVEILKMHQKTKRRVELQLKSKQTIIGHGIEGMELTQQNEDTLGRSRASLLRDETRNEAHQAYLASNFTRMERNQLHRQYCLEATRERVAYRQSLEEGIGTYFSKEKSRTFRTVGVEGPEATNSRFPTVDVLYEKGESIRQQTRLEKEEADDTSAARAHMQALDDKLWGEHRAHKHEKAQRVREVPYSLDSRLLKQQ